MSERIYLDVPFAEEDEAKHFGARWDPSVRRWWADPATSRLDQLERWLPRDVEPSSPSPSRPAPPLPPPGGPAHATVALDVLGLRTRCWRCQAPTTALVGLVRPGSDVDGMLDCSDPDVLAAATTVDPAAAARHRIGVIKVRRSSTVGHGYLSNGCFECDALLGAFHLRDETNEVIDHEGMDGLERIATIILPCVVFGRLVASHFGELDDDE